MRFVIVTGMSGAGKSTALKMLEDAEYFCVDNLPIPLVEKFAQLTADGTSGEIQKVAVGIDIRSGQALPDLQNVLEWMSINGICYEILFLDASDDVLVKRYKETRRTHPLAGLGRVDEGIRKERKALEFLKKDADYILDTSQLLTRELKAELDKIFVQDQKFKNLMITVLSFGFKYGIPADSDLVFDVRFLPNPYYVEGMRPLSGNDAPVRDYVMGFETAQVFAEKLEDMIRFLIPNYISEGKHQLIISIGCTGGKHRSALPTSCTGVFPTRRTMESGLSTGIWKKTPSEKEFRGGRMSFSSEVKEELSRHLPTARHCQIAETAAILSLCGQISEKDGTIRIQTENAYVARKYFTLLKKTFNIEAELAVKLNQKENTYLIRVNDREETRQILQAVKLHETDRQLAMPIPAVVVQRQCCKRAFLRGAFLASGSISDPNRFTISKLSAPMRREQNRCRNF